MIQNMKWDADKIKQLRRRMGWSQSDLARRLNCDWHLISQCENSNDKSCEILDGYLPTIEILDKQCDAELEQVMTSSFVEVILEESQEEQVDNSAVKDRFFE